jgi:hypothetical protein
MDIGKTTNKSSPLTQIDVHRFSRNGFETQVHLLIHNCAAIHRQVIVVSGEALNLAALDFVQCYRHANQNALFRPQIQPPFRPKTGRCGRHFSPFANPGFYYMLTPIRSVD